jgi:hypothetical protein
MHRSCVESFRHRACSIFGERITDGHLLSRLTLIRAATPDQYRAALADVAASPFFVAYWPHENSRCSHWTAVSGDRWPDDVRLS